MVVDHIIPTKGKNVSGLHVLNNLQYLTPSQNNSKKNFFGDFQGWSKEYEKEYMKEYAKKYKEKLSEYRKKYRNNPINKAKAVVYAKEYHAKLKQLA